MKRLFVYFFALCSLLFADFLYAQFSYRELAAGHPATLQRTGEISWRYEQIIPKRGESFSYFAQNYSLGLSGPLISPLLGQAKLDLDYALGANVLGYPWISKEKQKLLSYSFGTYFSPVFLNRLFSLTTNFSQQRREQFADRDILTGAYLQTSELVSFGFTPPWQINFFNRNNRSRGRNKGLTLTFPQFFYSYIQSNATDALYQKASFDRDSITEHYRVNYSFHRVRFDYHLQKNKDIDLLRTMVTRHDLAHDYNLSWTPEIKSKIASNVYFNGNYRQAENLLGQKTFSDQANTFLVIDLHSFKLLGLSNRPAYRNSFSWSGQAKTWSQTNSFLLNSQATVLRRVGISNTITYNLSNRNGLTNFNQGLYEWLNLRTGFSFFRLFGVTAGIDETFSFLPAATTQEERWFTRVDLPRIFFLRQSGEYTISKTRNLSKKEITAHSTQIQYNLGGEISPIAYFLNGLFNGNGNHNGNGNGNGNHNGNGNRNYDNYNHLLTLGMNLGLGEDKDLLTQGVNRYLNERYGLHSEPLNGYLVIDFSYERQWRWTDKQLILRREYFNSNITLQSGRRYTYRGIIVEAQVQSRDLKDLNIYLGLRYEYGGSTFALRWRAIAYGELAPYRAYNLVFTRKI